MEQVVSGRVLALKTKEVRMTAAQKIPCEQHIFAARSAGTLTVAMNDERRDLATGAQSGLTGDADVTLNQGRFGNLRQNPAIHWKVQQR